MRIDNSAAKAWWFCPAYYQEAYVNGIKRKPFEGETAARDFGKRVHELLEEHFKGVDGLYPPCSDEMVEAEAREMVERYKTFYPVEEFDVVDVERTFIVPVADGRHEVTGKMDGVVRARPDATLYQPGMLYILEHKTERRGAATNNDQAWAARAQASIYIRSAALLYGEPFGGIILDVLTRRSPKGQIPPEFRRSTLLRTEEEQDEATDNLVWVADRIEELRVSHNSRMWPQDRESCMRGTFKCEYYNLHVVGRSDFTILRDYGPAEDYLGEKTL